MKIFMLALWLIPIAGNIYWDRKGRKPDYLVMFLLRGMAAIIHGVLFDVVCNYFPNNLWQYSSLDLLIMWLPLLTFQVTSYWILFELGLNKVRGREPLYFDRKERDSGWLDKVFDRLGNVAHFIAKLLALMACVVSVIAIL